jgi:DNA-binding NarL/FixJ family response regulator
LIVIGPEGDEELVIESIMAGARAYLDLKASPRIVRLAMEEATNGSIWAPRRLLSQLIDRLLGMPDAGLSNEPPHLTERESQVLALILTARSNREIARQLGIEERTVQAHVSRLMRKTGTDNRINLLMRSSNPELLKSAGIADRRQVERRHGERRAGPPEGRRDVTDK